MSINPNRLPLFGGQIANILFNEGQLELLKISNQSPPKIYLEIIGKFCCHFTNVNEDNNLFYFVVPENDCVEEKEVKIYIEKHSSFITSRLKSPNSEYPLQKIQISEYKGDYQSSISRPQSSTNVKIPDGVELELLDFTNLKICYFDDQLDSVANFIVNILPDSFKIIEALEKLYDSSCEYIKNDAAVENFDFKLSKLIKKKLVPETIEYIMQIPTAEINFLLKAIELKELKQTKELFGSLANKNDFFPPNTNFIYDINETNARTTFKHLVYIKHFYSVDLCYLTHSFYNTDIDSNKKGLLISKYIQEVHFTKNTVLDKNDVIISASKLINFTTDPKTASVQSINENGEKLVINIISECESRGVGDRIIDEMQSVKYAPVIKCNQTKNMVNPPASAVASSTPEGIGVRGISRVSTMKSFSFTNKVISESVSRLSMRIENSITGEGLKPSCSDTIQTKSPENDELVDIKEFIQRQVEHVANDTSFILSPIVAFKQNKYDPKSPAGALAKFFNKVKKPVHKEKTVSRKTLNVAHSKTLSSSASSLNALPVEPSLQEPHQMYPSTESSTSSCNLGDELMEEVFPEAENWSEIADSKLLKKLSSKEIKRQDTIYETIKSEFNYLKTIKTMYNVYYKGLTGELKIPTEKVDTLIPRIVDLSAIHGTILANWRQVQTRSENLYIESIGDPLLFQFSEPLANSIIVVYSDICSNQIEARDCYEELLNEKKFRDFIESCRNTQYLRRLSIKECQTLIAQRMIKYPMLIERILSYTKESDKEYPKIALALKQCRELLHTIDQTVKHRLNEKALLSYRLRADNKYEIVTKRNVKYRLIDLLTDVVLQDSTTARLKSRLKLYDVIVLLFEKYVLVVTDTIQKIVPICIDHKNPILFYPDLMVRVAAADSTSLFIVDQKNADFYELVFFSEQSRTGWLNAYNHANEKYRNSNQNWELDKQKEASVSEFTIMFNQLDNQAIILSDLHRALLYELQNAYTYLKTITGGNFEKKSRRFSLVENDPIERMLYSDVNEILKLTLKTLPSSSTLKSKDVSHYRPRTKTISYDPKTLKHSSPSIMRKETTRVVINDDSTVKKTLNDMLIIVDNEINLTNLVKSKSKNIDGKPCLNPIVEKSFNTINEVNSQLIKILEEFQNLLNSTKSQYECISDLANMDQRKQIFRCVLNLKSKLDQLSNVVI